MRSPYACVVLFTCEPQRAKKVLRKVREASGKARAKKLTTEQRKESARKAAKARWAKQKGKFSRDTET